MGGIKFGTDGWRAVISEDFTFDNVKKVAQAIADYIKTQQSALRDKTQQVVVGYDTRFLSDKYAELVACVIAANGIKTVLADRPAPTPSVSYAIKDKKLLGGVVITASHNPAQYNGIKYKTYYGGSATPEMTKAIEGYLEKNQIKYAPQGAIKTNGMVKTEDIVPEHLDFIKRYVDMKLLKKMRLKILVDAMHGAGNSYMAELLKLSDSKVDTIHGEVNPGFGGISPEPKLPNLAFMAKTVKSKKYDIGLAMDGDADRLGVAIPSGELLTGHKIMALLLLHLFEDKHMKGDVVQTICGTSLINKICKKYNLKMHETAVGFKYISDVMIKEDVIIGGEETGGIAFKNSIPERDALMAGLLILEMMAMRKKNLGEILKAMDKEYGTYEYRRLDVKYPDEKKNKLMESLKTKALKKVLDKKVVDIKSYDGYKFICDDHSWLMLRLSGTEPILRIYAEASNEQKALKILQFGKDVANRI